MISKRMVFEITFEMQAFSMGWIGLDGAAFTASLWSSAALASDAKPHFHKVRVALSIVEHVCEKCPYPLGTKLLHTVFYVLGNYFR